jgi:hypothetical protein
MLLSYVALPQSIKKFNPGENFSAFGWLLLTLKLRTPLRNPPPSEIAVANTLGAPIANAAKTSGANGDV